MALLQSCREVAAVERYGGESIAPVVSARIRRSNDPGAQLLRHSPDGVLCRTDERVVLWDAKAAKAIERDAYESYLKYHAIGHRVVLFFKRLKSVPLANQQLLWQDIQELQFIDSYARLSRYDPARRWPIDEDGWVAPRQNPDFRPTEDYSGTPFRYIDFSKLVIWSRQQPFTVNGERWALLGSPLSE